MSKGKGSKSIPMGSDRDMGSSIPTGSIVRFRKLDPVKTAEAVFKYWPNLSKAAEVLGVSRQALGWHQANSPWFQRITAEANAKGCDKLEQVLYERGVSGEEYTFNDRIAYLRAHRPELYNPAKVLKIESSTIKNSEAKQRAQIMETVIDAEIVDEYKKRKARKK